MRHVFKICALIALPFGSAMADPFDDLVEALPNEPQDIRLFVASTPEVLSVVTWDDDGQVVFPPPDGVAHHSDSIVLNRLDELQGLSADAPLQGVTKPSALSPDRTFHCRNDPAICMVLDATALGEKQASEPAHDPYYAYFESVMVWFYVIIGLCVLFVIGFYFVVKSRPEIPLDPESFAVGGVQVNPRRRTCLVDGAEQQLTARDITLLRCLANHAGEVVSKDTLYDVGWGRDYMPNSRALEQHMLGLRRKLGEAEVIETVHGQGYRVAG